MEERDGEEGGGRRERRLWIEARARETDSHHDCIGSVVVGALVVLRDWIGDR